MADKHMKRCPTWLIVGQTLPKTTQKYHCIPTGMAMIKKTKNTKC